MIRYEKDPDNIVTLTLDMKGEKYNIINHDIGQSFLPVLKHLKAEKAKGTLRGVIITSAKKHFLVGSDLDFSYNCTDALEAFESYQTVAQFFRDLESPGVPVVAALNGTALGPGFELALACHHRICLDKSDIRIGLPEITFGLMPGSGGCIRLMWLIGLEKAYHVVTDGLRYSPKEALAADIIDELATDEKELKEKARNWILDQGEARRAWDTAGEEIPKGDDPHETIGSIVRKLTAQQYKQYYLNYPAYQAVLSVMAEGSRVDFDTACKIESRYAAQLTLSKEAKNLMKVFWYDLNSVKKGENRPKGYGRFRPRKIGVIGAGMMGSGIAFSCAMAGMEVVLKDISRSVAEKGKSYSEEKLALLVQKNEKTEGEAKEILSRITATEQIQAFENCDLIIEAVFENQQLKSKIIKEAEAYLDQYCIIASNTSSIPISKLATTTLRPENFCGMRFFRPVDEEPLVEIVKGAKTTDETIARAFDFIKLIKKTPIIVKDSWGFYAGRVRNTYILEGIAMLQEGYSAALIENLGLQTGMSIGPLQLADDLGLDMVLEYERQAAELYGPKYVRHPASNTLESMIEGNRSGKDNRAGFYEYHKDDTKQLWYGLNQQTKPSLLETGKNACKEIPENTRIELSERLIFAQVLEAVWCLQEGVIHSEEEANLGSVYGWRFPACKGGVVQFIHDYGKEAFIQKSQFYQQVYGQRFRAPKWLKNPKS